MFETTKFEIPEEAVEKMAVVFADAFIDRLLERDALNELLPHNSIIDYMNHLQLRVVDPITNAANTINNASQSIRSSAGKMKGSAYLSRYS